MKNVVIAVERIKVKYLGMAHGVYDANSFNIKTRKDGTKIATKNPRFDYLKWLSKKGKFPLKVMGKWKKEVNEVR